jgi:diguanylate cyclase (GGDEF)-like protein
VSSRFRLLLTLAVLGAAAGAVAPVASAADQPDATNQSGRVWRASTARSARDHAGRNEMHATHLRSLIEEMRFNQAALSFDHGITVGPETGNLEIRFAVPESGAADHLSYRLLGFDTEWREEGKDHEVVYEHLAPGRYEFDFQQAQNTGLGGSVMESIPITVIAPYWNRAWFRALCMLLLMFTILIIYKLRVSYLVRHNRRLEEEVSQTKAELTLTAKVAGDAQEALKEQALKDALTGLWNRRAIFAMLEREIYRAQRDRISIALLMLDLDYFKNINDNYGHLIGDEVLRETAGRLRDVMRPYDFAGRYGGEEFLVVLPSCSPHNGAQRAEDFRRAIAESPVPTCIGPLAVTCSLGVAAYDGTMAPEDLIHRADEALYRAKRLGRNRVCAANQAAVVGRR